MNSRDVCVGLCRYIIEVYRCEQRCLCVVQLQLRALCEREQESYVSFGMEHEQKGPDAV